MMSVMNKKYVDNFGQDIEKRTGSNIARESQ
jgi:hypothetical protein